MKFVVSWTERAGGSSADNEAAVKRALQVFSKWSPPQGDIFHQFLTRVDGRGGYAVIETDNALNLLDSAAKFGPWFEFAVTPVVDIAEGTPVASQAIDWRESIS
ncbi:MAG TPA: DUF3303 family protein [Acidimicrobiales bacterium]|nr:DUF3303 family protein [Acidimicrobiales bacterium]